MSASLVRKSLELLESDSSTKKLKKIRLTERGKTKRSRNQKKSAQLTVEDARKRLRSNVDNVEENLKCLQHLSTNIEQDVARKILQRATNEPPEKKVTKEEEAVFTEEDFEKFEKEYFCN